MGCFTLGGHHPLPTLKVTLDQRDITDAFESHVTSFLSGTTVGLKYLGSRTQLWSGNFTLTADHDQSRIVCAATVESFQVEKVEALVDVVYQPKIHCKQTSAFLFERNVFIDCRIKSKPQYFHYYWLLNYSSPSSKSSSSSSSSWSSHPSSFTFSSSPSASSSSSSSLSSSSSHFHPSPTTPPSFTLTSGSQYDGLWTEVKDRIDGITEIQLYFSEVTQERFRHYTIVVENIVGTTAKRVLLLQKHRKTQSEILSDASISNADTNQTSAQLSTFQRKTHEREKPPLIFSTNSGFSPFQFFPRSSAVIVVVVVLILAFQCPPTSSFDAETHV